MFVIAKNGHSAYRLDKVTAVKLEDNTKDFKEKHPEIPGILYSIRLYYNPGNLNIYTTLAAYGDYETAFSEYVSFLAAIAADRPVYDFSGLIFQTRKEEPDMEEELDLEPD